MVAEPGSPLHDPAELKEAFRRGGRGKGKDMEGRLEAVAQVGAASEREVVKEQIIERLDDLIWRRKLNEKSYDQLEEIKELVEDL